MSAPRKIRWLIAHEPQELFVRTARAFSEELEKRIPGQIVVEIVTVPEYIKEHPDLEVIQEIINEDLTKTNVAVDALWNALHDDIHMSQTQISIVAAKDPAFDMLDLPFVFDDHEHVSRVLEGSIGKEMLEHLEEVSDVKGLAFTYSGGYRVVGSNHKINDLHDLGQQRVIVSTKGPRADTFKTIGAEPVIVSPHLWGGQDCVPENHQGNAIETTYLRFDGKHILKTNHSVFMTTILTSKEFWNSLTKEQQTAFEESAHITARIERNWAIEDAEKFEQNAKQNGIEITELSDEDTIDMKHKSRYTYIQFSSEYGDLIKRIRQG